MREEECYMLAAGLGSLEDGEYHNKLLLQGLIYILIPILKLVNIEVTELIRPSI